MKPLVTFDASLIAPYGMNCGTCIGYLREKNTCPDCRAAQKIKQFLSSDV